MASSNEGSLKQQISNVFEASLRVTVPDEQNVLPIIDVCTKKEFGDYQCNNAMSLWNKIRSSGEYNGPQSIGQAIIRNLQTSELIESCSIAAAGFVNIKLSTQWIANTIHKMLKDGIDTWAPKPSVKRAIVDFSSPNIAKELHVGHLRSTIIGDTIARMLEYSKVDVLRRNHVGDWGTQFGMLIQYLFEKFPNGEVNDQDIGEVEVLYKASKERFDCDAEFRERAQQAVVRLQSGEEKYRNAWAQICELSRKEYEKLYQSLGVHLEEKGESFYNPYIPETLGLLRKNGLIEESEGAEVIFNEGYKIPLIVVKRDGGFNYATTDLTALWYRLHVEKSEWIIYVTDVGQQLHFKMVFASAQRAGWLPTDGRKYPRASHVTFGFVHDDNGKRFRSRSSEVVRLADLLYEAKTRCKAALVERGKAAEWTSEELEHIAEAVGYSAIKYSDLKNNRSTNYKYNFDQMLSDKGDTAISLVCTCSNMFDYQEIR